MLDIPFIIDYNRLYSSTSLHAYLPSIEDVCQEMTDVKISHDLTPYRAMLLLQYGLL